MKSFITTLVILICCFSVFADSLPNRQRRLSIHHLESSPSGTMVLNQFDSLDQLFKIYRYDAISSKNPLQLYEILDTNQGLELRLNSELLASSSVYLSWVLAIAITALDKYRIEKNYQVKLPRFIEFSYWTHSIAMRHWQELAYPNEHDYANHPDDHIAEVARKLRASTTELSRFHKVSRKSFLDKIKTRHLALGYDNITIDQFIEKNSGNTKRAAQDLKNRMKY
ncbi:MAG: hypothetical protein VX642_08835 [Bdellovibrionota bacterium]|nr:hypothetical protein [Bdellovibrionota bacterium]